jgi:hypothetical protein
LALKEIRFSSLFGFIPRTPVFILSEDDAVAEETSTSREWFRFLDLMLNRKNSPLRLDIDDLRPFLKNEMWKTKLEELESQ